MYVYTYLYRDIRNHRAYVRSYFFLPAFRIPSIYCLLSHKISIQAFFIRTVYYVRITASSFSPGILFRAAFKFPARTRNKIYKILLRVRAAFRQNKRSRVSNYVRRRAADNQPLGHYYVFT